MPDLTGPWDFRDLSGEVATSIRLPGDAVSALHEAGFLPDPYKGRNEYQCRWVAERDWVARKVVVLEDDACELVASGLDGVIEVRVNGATVLKSDNAFRRYRVNLQGVVRAGENAVELIFRSVVHEAAQRQQQQPFFVPFSENCPIPNGNMLRKPACDFGWDWNIALAPFGVWGDLKIEPRRDIRIEDVLIEQAHGDGRATVSVTVTFAAEGARQLPWSVALCGVEMSGTVQAADGRFSATMEIEAPELWWPAGQGAQTLHELIVRLADTSATRRVGLRDIALVTKPDAAGASFAFHVNGRPVFARGANWIPADALSGRITREAVRDLLQSAVDANMNMIRVWGGGRYEPDWFYDFCDELGLMVWQDFMFACNLYPSDEAFLQDVADEVRDNVARLAHHPSIALWCGDNELVGALGWYPESRANRDRYLVAYDRLNRTIETSLKETLPGANWWPSSPSRGRLDFGDGWHDDSSGDMHFWSVWHEGRDFEHYRDVSPRFCSEFGFQSYLSLDVIRRFARPQDMNIASPVMESHQKNAGGNARIAETMFRYFRFPVNFESFVYLSQVQQGLAIKTAVSHWRGLKPHCMGTLYWQLNDTWPVCSWSSLDHGGGWKLLHHVAKGFFRPVLVAAAPDGDKIKLRAINDLPHVVDLHLEVFAANMQGRTRALGAVDLAVPTDRAVEAFSLEENALGPDEILGFAWCDEATGRAEDYFAPKPWKAYDLLPADVSAAVKRCGNGWKVTLEAKALAPFVALEADRPGRFSRNGLTLLPGRPEQINFASQDVDEEPKFMIRDLHAATYGPET